MKVTSKSKAKETYLKSNVPSNLITLLISTPTIIMNAIKDNIPTDSSARTNFLFNFMKSFNLLR